MKYSLLIWDFSRTILFPKDANYSGGLNKLAESSESAPGSKFWDMFVLNAEILEFIDSIKEIIPSIIFTAGFVQNHAEILPKLNSVFKGIETVKSIGSIVKTNPESYLFLCKKYNSIAENTIYIDDGLEHVQAAKKAGLKTIQMVDNQTVMRSLQRHLEL